MVSFDPGSKVPRQQIKLEDLVSGAPEVVNNEMLECLNANLFRLENEGADPSVLQEHEWDSWTEEVGRCRSGVVLDRNSQRESITQHDPQPSPVTEPKEKPSITQTVVEPKNSAPQQSPVTEPNERPSVTQPVKEQVVTQKPKNSAQLPSVSEPKERPSVTQSVKDKPVVTQEPEKDIYQARRSSVKTDNVAPKVISETFSQPPPSQMRISFNQSHQVQAQQLQTETKELADKLAVKELTLEETGMKPEDERNKIKDERRASAEKEQAITSLLYNTRVKLINDPNQPALKKEFIQEIDKKDPNLAGIMSFILKDIPKCKITKQKDGSYKFSLGKKFSGKMSLKIGNLYINLQEEMTMKFNGNKILFQGVQLKAGPKPYLAKELTKDNEGEFCIEKNCLNGNPIASLRNIVLAMTDKLGNDIRLSYK